MIKKKYSCQGMKVKIQYDKKSLENYFYEIEINKNHFCHQFYFNAIKEFASNELKKNIVNNVLFADMFIWKQHERLVLNEVREKYVFKFADFMEEYIFEMYKKTCGL